MPPAAHASSGSRALRGAGGLHAAWEQQQQAAEVVAAAGRIPQQGRSKPALLAAQLQPVLAALREAAAAQASEQQQQQEEGEDDASSEEDSEAGAQPGTATAQQHVAAAAAHLRRLLGIDRQSGANAALLLWLLLGQAPHDEQQGKLLLHLFTAMGWDLLLLEAAALSLAQPHGQPQPQLVSLAAAAAASAAAGGGTARRAAASQLVLSLASCARQQLEEHSRGGSSSARLVACLDALQQVLLVCPAVAAAPPTADGLRRLSAAADASMALLMAVMQQGRQLEEGQQALFQRLAQLRARLALSLCGAGSAGSSGGGAADDDATTLLRIAPAGCGTDQTAAAQAWRSVLLMPSTALAAPAGGGGGMHPSLLQFLASRVAAECLLQATSASGSSECNGSASGGRRPAAMAWTAQVAGLPGVRFPPPPQPLAPRPSPADDGDAAEAMAAAADAAAFEMQQDAGCLGPAQLAVAALQMAEAAAPEADGAAPQPAGLPWPALLDLAAAAAASASAPREQQQLLLLLLHGRAGWLQRLRRALAADERLQQRWRRDLVSASNRLASDPSGGRGAPAVVHGEERRRRSAAAVAVLLPLALLCPEAALERLLTEAVVQAGEQVSLLLDILREMAPLPAYHPSRTGPPLLLALLARMLAGASGHRLALDTQASRDAFLQLVAGLCGASLAVHACSTTAAAPAGAAPLLRPAAVLQHVVSPALDAQLRAGPGGAADQLRLCLQLADLLAAAVEPAAAAGAAGEAGAPLAALQPLLHGLVSLDSRRVDRSAAALQVSPDTLDLAARLVRRSSSGSGGGSGDSSSSAGAYFQAQLQPLLGGAAAGAGAPPHPQQLQELRPRLLALLAALLPGLTAAEAGEVLQTALPAIVQAALLPAAARQQAGRSGGLLPGAHAAAVEVTCRSVQLLALQPRRASIAGEQAAAAPASPLRQAAVERLLQHLTQHCARLAAGGEQLRLEPAEAQALGLRCFRELCLLVAALQPSRYDCATLQAGLLRLAQQLLPPRPAAADQAAAAPGVSAALMAAAEQALPAGRLRDVVLLGLEQQAP